MTAILRQVATDNDFVRKRLMVLQGWIVSGTIEPWIGVVIAEWIRTEDGRRGDAPTMEQFEALFDGEIFEAMREQVDGPWMVYADQARAQRSNNFVMGFLAQLEDAIGEQVS